MDARERIKEKMQEFEADLQKEETAMQELRKGLRIAFSLYETAQQIRSGNDEKIKDIEFLLLDNLQNDFTQWYANYKALKSDNPAEFVRDIKPIMDVVKLYYSLVGKQESDTGTEAPSELPAEIIDILNIADTDEAMLDDNPILRTMTRKGIDVANYGEAGHIKIIEHGGKLTPFHAEVFSTAIKAYRSKKVTKEGYIVLTENQAIKIMLGTSGTPSEKQKNDFRQAWEDMRAENMTYETTETLAQIMGIEQEQLEDFVPGIKPGSTNVVEEYFVQGLKVIKRQTVNGKQTDIYLIKPSDIVKKCIDNFPWYEEISPDIQRVLKEDKGGNLTIWGYSKKRIKMKQYIFSWVYKNKRARANDRKKHRLQLPYETIFEECGINTSHRQEKARRIEDVETVLSHLKRTGEIADWKQYADKTGKARGIEIYLYKERLQ
jgi:hypothetical protein